MKVDDKYLQRLGVLPYEDERPRRRNNPRITARLPVPPNNQRLRAGWTIELEEDLQAVHGLGVEDITLDNFVWELTPRDVQDALTDRDEEMAEREAEHVIEPDSLNAFRQWLRGMRGNRDNRT